MDAGDPRYPAVQALTTYWLAHPHASDSLEGISQWWLGGSSAVSVVEAALQWLVEHRVVSGQRAADGRVRYRLADTARPGSA